MTQICADPALYSAGLCAKASKKTAGIPVGLLRIFGNPWRARDQCRSS